MTASWRASWFEAGFVISCSISLTLRFQWIIASVSERSQAIDIDFIL